MIPTTQLNEQDEITLREFILRVRRLLRYLWSQLPYILGAGILVAAYFVWQGIQTPSQYSTTLTFMVNEDDGGGGGGINALLGQFGLGGSSASEYNLEKIATLSTSRKIVRRAILDSLVVDGEVDYLANHLIDTYQLNEYWREVNNVHLIDFRFSPRSDSLLTDKDRRALKALYSVVTGNEDLDLDPLINVGYNEETGILFISATTLSEPISLQLAESIYGALSEFYINKSIEKQQSTYDKLSEKVDSLEKEVNRTAYTLGRLSDQSLGVFERLPRIPEQRYARDLSMLTIMYGEAIKNRETADFILKNATPYFQVIDEPLGPLTARRPKWWKELIKGGVLGIVATVIILFFGYLYQRTMYPQSTMYKQPV